MNSFEVTREDRATWECLATALRELMTSSSIDEVANVTARAAGQLCDADSIQFQRFDGSLPATVESANMALDQVVEASVSIASGGSPQDALLTVNWNSSHVVTDLDREFLDILASAAALALRTATTQAPLTLASAFQPQERARFFDFQRQVRSLLAIIRSIVRRMADTPGSVEEYAAHLEGRLGAIARVQGFLLRAPEALVDLEELVRSEFLAQSIQDQQLRIYGPRILLDPKAAENLGLALHELTTNSIKFGALGHSGDQVHVLWRLERARVVLDWQEHVGRALPQPDSRGFGFELIEQMFPYELGGASSIVVHPDGLRCSLIFAVPPLEPH
jgi:two-component sensor histidine kinase